MIDSKATSLFAVPNFFRGMARAFDMGSTLNVYNTSKNDKEADAKAIYSDWSAVGDDMRDACMQWEINGQQES